MNKEIWNNIEKMSTDVQNELTYLLKDERATSEILKTADRTIKVSVCIMTFNEERVIKRCIDSVINFADEIIIIDTGSTDKTREIIEKNFPNIHIYSETVCENFSEIRNRMTEIAKNDWIFQIDADEYLGADAEKIICQYIALLEHIDIVPKIISPILTNHDGTIIDNTRRIYKKNEYLKYFGRVHEELRYKNIAKTPYFIIKVNYFHDGYKEEIIKEKQKYKRNIFLLNKMIEEEKKARWYYFLAREKIYARDKIEDIKQVLDEGLEIALVDGNEYLLGLTELYFQIPSLFIDYKKIEKYVKYCLLLFSNNLDCYYYDLFVEVLKHQQSLYLRAKEQLELTSNMEMLTLIDGEGDNYFWILGYIFWMCNRTDLTRLMWGKINTPEYKYKIRMFKENVNDFLRYKFPDEEV